MSQNFRGSFFWKDILVFFASSSNFLWLSIEKLGACFFEEKFEVSIRTHTLFDTPMFFTINSLDLDCDYRPKFQRFLFLRRNSCYFNSSSNFLWLSIKILGACFLEKMFEVSIRRHNLSNTPMVCTKNSPYLACDYELKLQRLLFLNRYSCFGRFKQLSVAFHLNIRRGYFWEKVWS